MSSLLQRTGVGLVLLIVVLPIVFLLSSFFTPIQFELSSNYITGVALTTLLFITLVTLLSTILGTTLAYLTTIYEFSGSKFLSWALFLPFAVPPYVLAFVHLGLWENILNTNSILFASGVLSLSLYPYVYLFSKAAFQSKGKRSLEVAQSLGRGPLNAFITVMIPSSWPWITGGALFVLMETLSDFGAVSIFNIDTVSVAIYKAWFSYFSIGSANRIAAVTVIIVGVILYLESWVRRKRQFYSPDQELKPSPKKILKGRPSILTSVFCFSIASLAFFLPFAQLVKWSFMDATVVDIKSILPFLLNSLSLSLIATVLIVSLACYLAVSTRLERKYSKVLALSQKLASVGYALPGAVLAVISFTVITRFFSYGFIKNSIIIIIFGYSIRFLTVGLNPINTGFKRLSKNIDDSARSLGCGAVEIFRRIFIPTIKKSIITASLLVFIEVMKEMPITLMTRPFGWDTLSVKIFEYTSEGEWEKAALPAIILVCVGIIPVLILSKNERSHE
ncbi:hypothetical protein DID80_01835 [Candidatus Marinamargulisbacteria bacterium SCGC AAA071-K20]|nr:hypothetical protein DID80_01835 [Candidatus Marinamargulisbacteria bacterium SCGC AAA071-K20]